MRYLLSPMQAQVVQWLVAPGAWVREGSPLLLLEAMKIEHEVPAPCDGRLLTQLAAAGELVQAGDPLAELDEDASPPQDALDPVATRQAAPLAGHVRVDLERVRARHAHTLDEARPEAVAKRHARGQRMARENIADLCDDGSFLEYGALAVAAQRSRRSKQDLIVNTPADGLVAGIGSVNRCWFPVAPGERDRTRAVVMAYDATVLAGTQGARNHAKTDRLLGIALA